MSDIVGDLMVKCFAYLARGTIAEEAQLKINFIPIVCECDDCGTTFAINKRNGLLNLRCPNCEGHLLHTRTGREFMIRDMKVI